MNKKYLNIFWVILAALVIIYEFMAGQVQFESTSQINWGAWVLVAIWFSIAAKNVYSFYIKQFGLNPQK